MGNFEILLATFQLYDIFNPQDIRLGGKDTRFRYEYIYITYTYPILSEFKATFWILLE